MLTSILNLRRLACGILALASFGALAQDWPGTKPVRLVVAALPGSSPDLTARILAEQLTKQTGGTFVVLNKAGANGVLALTEVVRAAPDGTTLLVGNINTNGLAPALRPKLYSFDVKNELRPITVISDGPSVLIASRHAPSTFKDSLAAWKAAPGKYAYFAAGPGSFGHVWFSMLQVQHGAQLLFVPVKGGMEGLQMLHEGTVQYSYVPITSFISQMRVKEVQGLFVTTPARLPEFPNVPTAHEVGLPPEFELNTWVGLFAPSKTDPKLVNSIFQAFTKAVKSKDIAQRYAQSYMTQTTSNSPEEFQKFVNQQIDHFKAVGERANIKVEE